MQMQGQNSNTRKIVKLMTEKTRGDEDEADVTSLVSSVKYPRLRNNLEFSAVH